MSKYIDVKISKWERMHFKDEADMNHIIDGLRKGLTPDYFSDEESGFDGLENLEDTDQYLRPEENGNANTVEVMVDGEMIFANGFYEEGAE